MKFNFAFIRSKVARRVVWLFFISTLVPISAAAFFSFTYVTDLLVEQSYQQLQLASKLYGMAVLDRLLISDNKLRKLSADLHTAKLKQQDLQLLLNEQNQVGSPHEHNEKQFDKLTLELVPATSLSGIKYDAYGEGKSFLYSQTDAEGVARIYLRRIVANDKNDKVTTVVAQLNNDFLWGDKDSLPFSTFLCVIDENKTVLFCPFAHHQDLLAALGKSGVKPQPRKLIWTDADGENLAVAWDLFVKSNFSGVGWRIISSRQKAEALMPVYAFHKIYPMVILFSLLLVLLLSLIQVRRIMLPLERLVSATRRLAKYEFGEPVKINTKDEFKELGDSFNTMATRLEKQFSALKILSEIDHLILTYPDLDVVLARIFETAHEIISCDFIAITLVDQGNTAIGWTHIKDVTGKKPAYVEKTSIPESEASQLLKQEEVQLIDLKTQAWRILDPLAKYDILTAQLCPISLDGSLRAIFSLGYRANTVAAIEDSGLVRDIIDRLAVALATADRDEKLYQQAHFDHLTGLPNRQLFNDRLEQHILQAHRKNQRAALLYIDLDRFKNINDSLGHASGDKVLRQVAERMRSCIRETDTISRLGGDEFVIVLSNISSPSAAGNIAENIIETIGKPYFVHSREIFVNASIGIAIYPEDGSENKELLAHADAAMYQAKDNGRGKYMFFEESMNREVLRRIEMEVAMRHALQREEFTLYYQPQIAITSGKVTGVEALIRWNHPELGLVSPDHFIPLAEECGLIEQIGEWVLHTACKQYRTWQDMDIAPARLAVNISSRQFMQANFVDVINRTLSNTGVLPQHLELEITESLLMDERINTKSIFSELDVMGIKLAIDDFGTGYSSLSYLKRFAVHTLKIDRAFTQHIPEDKQVTTLTLSIIAMAHALDMEVVAEGVETKGQLALLREHQCDAIQGYYFSKPLSADDLVNYLMQPDAIAARAEVNLPASELRKLN
jgi:diguanylate cyclase (GGDEF)-like protein